MAEAAGDTVTRYRRLRAWGTATVTLALAFLASRLASSFIATAFKDRPTPRDLLFEVLPYASWPQYVTDLAVLASATIIVVYLLRRRSDELPAAATLFGVVELVRAFIITLTPLAGPLGNGARYGLVRMTQNGEFPSGHAATVMLFCLLVDGEDAPVTRALMIGLVAVECGALLVSHGHYSIDIVGGLLLSAAMYRMWTQGHALTWIRRLATPR